VASLHDSVPLDIDRHPSGKQSFVWETLRTHLAASGHRVFTVVAEQEGHIIGLGQIGRRESVWHVERLLTADDLSRADMGLTVSSLLAAVAQAAADRGAVRLHAHVERRAEASEAFTRAGFVSYSYESVYWLPEAPAHTSEDSDSLMRPQESKDAWAVYQLYCAVTPRVVQQAEGLDAASWDIPSAAAMRALQQMGEQRWVLEIGGEILGYMRTRRLGRRLYLLVHPHAYSYVRKMIALGVREIHARRAIRCCLPEYQGELGISLEEEGFRFVGTQVALVKQMAAAVRAENRVLRPILEPNLGTIHSTSGR
jgi:hypothetical protein